MSQSGNLVNHCNNYGCEVFVRDLQAGITYWASTNMTKPVPGAGNKVAYSPALSADGRCVTFEVATSSSIQLAHHVLETGITQLITNNVRSNYGDVTSFIGLNDYAGPVISAHGQRVVFTGAGALTGSTIPQVYVWDEFNGSLRCVSLNVAGTGPGNQASGNPLISADGRTVVFTSAASDLVTNPVPNRPQFYARDLATEKTKLVSVDPTGSANQKGDFGLPVISADGRCVALDTTERGLVANDHSLYQNVYLRNLELDTWELISIGAPSMASLTANAASASALNGISSDSRFVVFSSTANNLVLNQVNPLAHVRAFTLTELVVVMAIMVIFSGLLMAMSDHGKEKTQVLADLANFREILMATSMYQADNQEFMPHPTWGAVNGGASGPDGWAYAVRNNGRLTNAPLYIPSCQGWGTNSAPYSNQVRFFKIGQLGPFLPGIAAMHCPKDMEYWNVKPYSNWFASRSVKITSYAMNATVGGYAGPNAGQLAKGKTYKGSDFKAMDIIYWEKYEGGGFYFDDAAQAPETDGEIMSLRHYGIGISGQNSDKSGGGVIGRLGGSAEFMSGDMFKQYAKPGSTRPNDLLNGPGYR